ncbi:MAG: M48 family metalloprotease [Deltaproteobacteria bacterium]|nr:MAG: M48 family metalloprotease [Deltaproteobacteria bacterium]
MGQGIAWIGRRGIGGASMHRAIVFACLLGALLGGVGCATRLGRPPVEPEAVEAERREQKKLALTLLLERQSRVWALGNRIRRAGAELCGEETRQTFGFFAVDAATLRPDLREVTAEVGLGPGVSIWSVSEGFPVAAEQLRRGDRIVAIAGREVRDLGGFERAMVGPFETGQLSMEIERPAGERLEVALEGALACDYRVGLLEDDRVNALADGKNVLVTSGMLRFTESDDELALVVGHELAHNALGHLKQQRAQVLAGLLVDLAIAVFGGVDTGGLFAKLGAIVYSEEMEADADYMGLYFSARADYAIEGAPLFWRRMAVEHPGSIEENMLATHPSYPERAVAISRTIEEIETKRRDGLPLVPEPR